MAAECVSDCHDRRLHESWLIGSDLLPSGPVLCLCVVNLPKSLTIQDKGLALER